MTSQINFGAINTSYPVAGVDNNSQGFRDNFTNTKTNFEFAATEITDLQNKVVLKAALTGTVLEAYNPTRNTVMVDWANSEYSMLRLQVAQDTMYGPGKTNNQVFLQYIMSLGAHGSHRF
jgi:hypothetical protein